MRDSIDIAAELDHLIERHNGLKKVHNRLRDWRQLYQRRIDKLKRWERRELWYFTTWLPRHPELMLPLTKEVNDTLRAIDSLNAEGNALKAKGKVEQAKRKHKEAAALAKKIAFDDLEPPKRGWRPRTTFITGTEVCAWVPEPISPDKRPEWSHLLPLSGRPPQICEAYAIIAAIHDRCLPEQVVNPWGVRHSSATRSDDASSDKFGPEGTAFYVLLARATATPKGEKAQRRYYLRLNAIMEVVRRDLVEVAVSHQTTVSPTHNSTSVGTPNGTREKKPRKVPLTGAARQCAREYKALRRHDGAKTLRDFVK